MKTGLTSVTFRKKSIEEIVRLTREAGLTGIEWGGDVHVAPGDTNAAQRAALLCREAGLEVLSYGSYFYADEGEDFAPILSSARALGAPVIRIWPGRKTYEDSTPEEFAALADRIRAAGEMAAAAGIKIGFEYHVRTATQTKEGAVALLKAVNLPNVGCYWQPSPIIPFEEHLAELRAISPWLLNLHVFHLSPDYTSHLLADGAEPWAAYLKEAASIPGRHDLILEFVKDEADSSFEADAATLRSWTEK